MKLNKTIGVTLLCLMIAIGAFGAFGKFNQFNQSEGAFQSVFTYGSAICPTVIRADGTVEELPCIPNTVTTAGLNHIKTVLGNAELGTEAFKYQAVGNESTPGAGDTTLDGEITNCGLARAAGQYGTRGNGNWSQTYQWTANASCSTLVVNSTALFNTSVTGGTMLCGGSFANSVTLQPADKLNVTYYTWIA